MYRKVALYSSLLAVASAQQAGTLTTETHPKLSWKTCTAGGSCSTVAGSIVLDSNWRWAHSTTGSENCYDGNKWISTYCPDNVSCAKNCAIDGADYTGTYGITASGDSLSLKFVTKHQYGTNIGSRTYLLESDTKYQMFKLKNKEFTFDVDVSKLPCGLNGALYFVQMDADGGLAKYAGNKAGAKYGTGYCDAQCPRDIKFINGEANVEGWVTSATDPNAGTGKYGTCCDEMDIWEANSISTAFTPHPCTANGQTRCTGSDCGSFTDRYNSLCDMDGCDFNSYRMGEQGFYGPGKTVNTNQKITVVTQFKTADNTDTGTLSEIRRVYVQNGVVIANSKTNVPGIDPYDSISDAFCDNQKTVFGDQKEFQEQGGLKAMGDSMNNGMVLVMSIWDDHAAHMLWLDSTYPTDADPTKPGIARGTCPTTSGDPKDVEAQSPDATVTFSNIRFGPIGSTYSGGTGPSSSVQGGASSTSSTASPGATGAPHWGQCGGIGWGGPTTCVSPFTCTKINDWYYQCL